MVRESHIFDKYPICFCFSFIPETKTNLLCVISQFRCFLLSSIPTNIGGLWWNQWLYPLLNYNKLKIFFFHMSTRIVYQRVSTIAISRCHVLCFRWELNEKSKNADRNGSHRISIRDIRLEENVRNGMGTGRTETKWSHRTLGWVCEYNKSILRFQRLVEYERENSTSLDTALVYYIKMKSQLQEIN